MKETLIAFVRTTLSVAGASVAGPVGGIVGGLVAGLLGSVLPGAADFASVVAKNVASKQFTDWTSTTAQRLSPIEKEYLNHDLQTAFRDAYIEALYDVGGVQIFPDAWKHVHRDVPEGVAFASTHAGARLWQGENPLAGQVAACLQELKAAVDSRKVLPLDPPSDQPAASVRTFLEADTSAQFNQTFYDQVTAPHLAAYPSLLREVPELAPHLAKHLLDRTLIHLGELLKKRTPAWRAFNRMLLEDLRANLKDVSVGQTELSARLDALLEAGGAGQPLTDWSDSMADLLSATGQIEKHMDERFDALNARVVSQHRQLLSRLDGLLASTGRMEAKLDRMLSFVQGGYHIEGQATMPLHKPPFPGEPPYKGLEYFGEADAERFFGRELLIGHLIGRLEQYPFLAVLGASGSGKSSVVRAGLLPVLKGTRISPDSGPLPVGSTEWLYPVITPTAHPLEALAALFTRSLALDDARGLVEGLRRDPHTLDVAARHLLNLEHKPHLLLVIDQFEELFTLCVSTEERRAFVAALLDAVGGGVIHVVLMLRADFYAQCAEFDDLRQAVAQHQEFIGPMTADELRRAIEEPARLGGWKFEPGLVDLIIRDVGIEPGALPLLSHALLETWRNRSSKTMTLESYAETGGVKGAIAKTAELVYRQRLTTEQQVIARSIFIRTYARRI